MTTGPDHNCASDAENSDNDEVVVALYRWCRVEEHRDEEHRDEDFHMAGFAYGHPNFEDGVHIQTPPVEKQFRWKSGLYVRAADELLYELLADDGQPWFSSQKHAPYRPAKV